MSNFARGRVRDLVLASSGLTTATTTYTSGDVLGVEMQANLATQGSASGIIRAVTITDAVGVVGAVDLFLFNAASSPAADNAANTWTAGNLANLVGIIEAATVSSPTSRKVVTWRGEQPYYAPAGILYVVAVTRTANAVFTGNSAALSYRLIFEAD